MSVFFVDARILSQVQAEMGLLRRVHAVTLREQERRCEIHKALNVEPFLRIARSQPHWFGHVTRMSQKKLSRDVVLPTPTEK